jgi:hypothetical protein
LSLKNIFFWRILLFYDHAYYFLSSNFNSVIKALIILNAVNINRLAQRRPTEAVHLPLVHPQGLARLGDLETNFALEAASVEMIALYGEGRIHLRF